MAELTRRYIVTTMGIEGPFDPTDPDAPFVLKPWKDPAALLALEAYRAACYPELAAELSAWIRTIRSGAAAQMVRIPVRKHHDVAWRQLDVRSAFQPCPGGAVHDEVIDHEVLRAGRQGRCQRGGVRGRESPRRRELGAEKQRAVQPDSAQDL